MDYISEHPVCRIHNYPVDGLYVWTPVYRIHNYPVEGLWLYIARHTPTLMLKVLSRLFLKAPLSLKRWHRQRQISFVYQVDFPDLTAQKLVIWYSTALIDVFNVTFQQRVLKAAHQFTARYRRRNSRHFVSRKQTAAIIETKTKEGEQTEGTLVKWMNHA
jgi:hypothetical protein